MGEAEEVMEKKMIRLYPPVRPNPRNEINPVFGSEEKEEGEEESGEEVVEGQTAKRQKEVRSPSTEDMRAHKATHIPFRNWCAECVAGTGKYAANRLGIDDMAKQVMGGRGHETSLGRSFQAFRVPTEIL